MEEAINKKGIDILREMGLLSENDIKEQSPNIVCIIAINDALDILCKACGDLYKKTFTPAYDLLELVKKWESEGNPLAEPFKLAICQLLILFINNPMDILKSVSLLGNMITKIKTKGE